MKALRLAKSNVDKYYSVVGITSELKKFFKILELMLPKFFKGVLKIYQDFEKVLNMSHKNVGRLRRPTSKEALKVLEKNLTLEIDFYNYVAQKLFKQEHFLNNQQQLS